ncbi:MAG: methionine--tRNA ligase [Patescibacteria group bacterium]|nr:methionine--tRNA ligase [Patescibacteria group bacterium]MCL5094267.1 methionine--tRNA ligase [Patescibacteria group bacterium]
MSKFYLTNAIPYVNAEPHIGFALEICQSDCIARYHRKKGDEVYFMMGADENSLKNVQAAEKAGKKTADFVKENTQAFIDLNKALNISNDDFIKTTEKRHIRGVEKIWKACEKDIYKKNYKGLYCVGCEEFKKESDLMDGCCSEHPNEKLEVVEEENYFFKLSNYQTKLEEIITKDIYKVYPASRKNEVLGFIKQGLEDFSISRSKERARGWGIPVPGDESQVIYVWFDALANYITGVDYAEEGEFFKKYWPADLHVIGKGILKFHAVYWPAMLLSAGVELPKELFVHGYLMVNGQKISKSLGNVIDPTEMAKKYGIDPLRYFLLSEIPATADGDFSEKRLEERYNSDLANGLGNLVQRIAAMIDKYLDGQIPEGHTEVDTEPFDRHMELLELHKAIEYVWSELKGLDQYIEEEKPWELFKTDKDELKTVLGNLATSIKKLNEMIAPFMPETSEKIAGIFKGPKVKLGKPLFPRLEG